MAQQTMSCLKFFLMELEQRCCQITFPLVVVGGDFNLIRKETDKSSGQGNKLLMNMFNSFIERCQLREIKRVGSRYTWTNKQDNQVLSNIDRVFMTTDWECKYPLATLKSAIRVGSDHWPLILDTGERLPPRNRQFFFEKQWLQEPDFREIVVRKWFKGRSRHPVQAYSVDKWHVNLCSLRSFLKGWGANLRGDYRRKKEALLKQISNIDSSEQQGILSKEKWTHRIQIEAELESLMEKEELYWKQRSGVKTILQGDANTKFFHLSANGRRRKKSVLMLEDGGVEVTDPLQIQKMIYDYYKQLFGYREKSNVKLDSNVWMNNGGLSNSDRVELCKPFTEAEVK